MDIDERRIRERAHELWVAAGHPEGDAERFWLAAERELAAGHAGDAAGESGYDKVLADSFPASDPPAHSGVTGPDAITRTSTQTTGGDPVAAADPGGTRPTQARPIQTAATPAGGKAARERAGTQTVRSGDRNDAPPRWR